MLLLSLLAATHTTLAQDDGTASILAPAADTTVFGSVQIIGTAAAPDFVGYQLSVTVDSDENADWVPIQDIVAQQVQDGVLGLWDTTEFPDGVYRIRLTVFRAEGDPIEAIVGGIVVANAQPTSIPTAPPTETPPSATEPPTQGPSPTPLIQQPPTNTPRAEGTVSTSGGGGVAPPPLVERRSARIDLGSLQSSCLSGACVTVVIFLLMGAYSALKAAISGKWDEWWSRLWGGR